MKRLTNDNKKILQSGLHKVKEANNKVLTHCYLDDDADDVRKMANETLKKVDNLQPTFSGDSDLYILTEDDLARLKKTLALFEDLIPSGDFNDSEKEKNYYAILKTLKKIFGLNE